MNSEILAFLGSGIVFGLSAGLSPGPMMTLVLSESVRYGPSAGVKVAFAPLFSDLPIIALSILLLSELPEVDTLLGLIAAGGALYLTWLGLEGIRYSGVEVKNIEEKPMSLRKGIITNFLNPNPYLFWITIGTPALFKALDLSAYAAVLFVFGMYTCLIGAKVMTAFFAGKSRRFLKSKPYVYTLRFLGTALLFFAGYFLYESLGYFGVL